MPQSVVPAETTSVDLSSGDDPPLPAAAPPAVEPSVDELVDQPPADAAGPDDEQQAWDRLAEDHPVPAADESDGDKAAYRGRRRPPRRGRPQWVGELLRAITARRAAVLAVAAGVLLIGSGVAVRLLDSSPVADPAPAPTTLPGAAPGPGAPGDQGRAANASPAQSATPTPTATESDPLAPIASHEAEAGEAGSHGQVVAMDGASGGQVVRLSGNRNGTFVRFTDVILAEPGQYEVTIFYFCDQDRTGTVSINNEDHLTVEFPSRGVDGTIGSVSVSTTLAAETNTIWIGTSGGAPLSVDRIALSH